MKTHLRGNRASKSTIHKVNKLVALYGHKPRRTSIYRPLPMPQSAGARETAVVG